MLVVMYVLGLSKTISLSSMMPQPTEWLPPLKSRSPHCLTVHTGLAFAMDYILCL